MLISDAYRELNRELHSRRADYGTSGHKWAPLVTKFRVRHECESVLDYGCGKQTLRQALGAPEWLTAYDPAIEGLDRMPEPADMVICGDVLEHIEPDCLDNVLAHIAGLTRKIAVFVVATRPAKKTLSDGRNAHLIVRSASWWIKKLLNYFELEWLQKSGAGEFVCVVSNGKDGDDRRSG